MSAWIGPDSGQSRAHHPLAGAGNPKLLTIIVAARNDNYMGNFRYRLTTSLNHLARNLKRIGRLDDVEILVTDWNSEIPLAKTLLLLPEAAHACQFIVVPTDIARAEQPPGVTFFGARAYNVALRRGQGTFLMLFDADCLMTHHSLQTLLSLLDGKLAVPFDVERVYLFCGRHEVPWEFVAREPSLDEWDRCLLLSSGQMPLAQGSYGLGTAGIALTMHRSNWHACRGYNEQLPGWGWLDAELTLRVTQRCAWVDLACIGMSVFHMEHSASRHRVPSTHSNNPHHVSPDYATNDENWGLGQYNLEIQTAQPMAEPERPLAGKPDEQVIAAWSCTRGQLLTELTSHPVREHLKKTVCARDVSAAEWGSLYALAWYSIYRHPRRYLEFGIQAGYAAVVVAAACPGVEVYGIDSWQPTPGRRIPSPPYVNDMLAEVRYRGYMRLVSGDHTTALHRLQESFIGDLEFDLTFVRGDLSAQACQQLMDLAPHLAPGGAVVFTASSLADFESAWDRFKQAYPQFTYWQCRARNTGLAIAASLTADSLDDAADTEENTLAAAWTGLRFTRACWPIWRRRLQVLRNDLQNRPIQHWPKLLWSRWTAYRQRTSP